MKEMRKRGIFDRRGEEHTNSSIHSLGRTSDDRPNNQQHLSANRHIPASKHVTQGSDKGTQSSVGNQIPDNEPGISVNASNVGVDAWEDAAEEIKGDLRADPEK